MQKLSTVLSVALLALSSAGAYADSSCDTVKMADPGWSRSVMVILSAPAGVDISIM